jgi:hypothetical protein
MSQAPQVFAHSRNTLSFNHESLHFLVHQISRQYREIAHLKEQLLSAQRDIRLWREHYQRLHDQYVHE